jgi:hypothetical protein
LTATIEAGTLPPTQYLRTTRRASQPGFSTSGSLTVMDADACAEAFKYFPPEVKYF